MYLQYDFELDVCAETIDTDNKANKVFVKQSKVSWSFNGDGVIASGEKWGWKPDPTAKDTAPAAWGPQITTGESPPTALPRFNARLDVMKWG